MNRFDHCVAELRERYGNSPDPDMLQVHDDIVAVDEGNRIFRRLHARLKVHDQLTGEEIALINRVLYFRSETMPFESWVVNRYLVRAHVLELFGWPACGLLEFPAEIQPAFKRYGPNLLTVLRRNAA